jgi:hypothetical protein
MRPQGKDRSKSKFPASPEAGGLNRYYWTIMGTCKPKRPRRSEDQGDRILLVAVTALGPRGSSFRERHRRGSDGEVIRASLGPIFDFCVCPSSYCPSAELRLIMSCRLTRSPATAHQPRQRYLGSPIVLQTVRKRGVAKSRAISIGTAALIAHSEPGDQVLRKTSRETLCPKRRGCER